MAYGDPPPQQQQRQIPQQYDQYDDPDMPPPPPGSEYVYPANPYAMQRENTDTALQVRKVIWEKIPPALDADGIEEWIDKFLRICEYASRIPGIDVTEFDSLCRDLEDIEARAHSEGRQRIVASKIQKMQFRLRLLVSRCDVPSAGISGIGSMITSKNEMKQDIRLPPPAAPAKSFPFLPSFGGKK
jgi:hypothetical protein